MDFFAHEDRARAQTRRLVVLFVLSLAAIIAVIYVPLVLLLNLSQSDDATVEHVLRTGPSPACCGTRDCSWSSQAEPFWWS